MKTPKIRFDLLLLHVLLATSRGFSTATSRPPGPACGPSSMRLAAASLSCLHPSFSLAVSLSPFFDVADLLPFDIMAEYAAHLEPAQEHQPEPAHRDQVNAFPLYDHLKRSSTSIDRSEANLL